MKEKKQERKEKKQEMKNKDNGKSIQEISTGAGLERKQKGNRKEIEMKRKETKQERKNKEN